MEQGPDVRAVYGALRRELAPASATTRRHVAQATGTTQAAVRAGLAALPRHATSAARSEAAAPVGIDPDTLSAIAGLPGDWHDSGNLGEGVVRRLAALVGERFPEGVALSAETGCGKSTLLFSHLSREHLCFTTEVGDSYAKTAASPLLDGGRVRFVLGPSQRTLQRHEWSAPLDVALIDGGHGYPFPDLDYYGFYPQIRPGGLLVVDDVHIPTVTSLFRFLREDAMWSLVALEGYTAFFGRTDAPTFDPLGDGWVHQRYNRDRFPHKEWLVPFYGPDWWLK